jgi:hypothetical protein
MPSDMTSLILYVTYIEVFRDAAGFCDIFIVPVLPMTSPRRNARMNTEFPHTQRPICGLIRSGGSKYNFELCEQP